MLKGIFLVTTASLALGFPFLVNSEFSPEKVREIGQVASDLLFCSSLIADVDHERAIVFLDAQTNISERVKYADGGISEDFHEGMRLSREAIESSTGDPKEAMKKRFTQAYCSDALKRAELYSETPE